MAHKKGQGSTRNGRDSNPQYRGIKHYSEETVWPGCIIVRQCGTKFTPGRNTGMGRDYTIFAKAHGKVHYAPNKRISIIPTEVTA